MNKPKMIIPQDLADKGFSIRKVSECDFADYFTIQKACYEKYVDEYFGGWNEGEQLKRCTDAFNETMKQSCFYKVLLNGKAAGFFAFDEQGGEIGGITIQMIEKARNKGVGSFYLSHITELSKKSKKPIVLKVFKSNPARELYARFVFAIYDETFSHYFMRYEPD
jgi:hypothetical protein